jgi:hypothetical protein
VQIDKILSNTFIYRKGRKFFISIYVFRKVRNALRTLRFQKSKKTLRTLRLQLIQLLLELGVFVKAPSSFKFVAKKVSL